MKASINQTTLFDCGGGFHITGAVITGPRALDASFTKISAVQPIKVILYWSKTYVKLWSGRCFCIVIAAAL